MTEHKIIKDNVIYIIPNDDLYMKYKSGKAFIDEYGRLMNCETPKYFFKEPVMSGIKKIILT